MNTLFICRKKKEEKKERERMRVVYGNVGGLVEPIKDIVTHRLNIKWSITNAHSFTAGSNWEEVKEA